MSGYICKSEPVSRRIHGFTSTANAFYILSVDLDKYVYIKDEDVLMVYLVDEDTAAVSFRGLNSPVRCKREEIPWEVFEKHFSDIGFNWVPQIPSPE